MLLMRPADIMMAITPPLQVINSSNWSFYLLKYAMKVRSVCVLCLGSRRAVCQGCG